MVWLEGGQGEVRGACDGPTLGLGGMYPPNCPTWTPPPQPSRIPPPRAKAPQTAPPSLLPEPPPPPPKGASSQQLAWGVVGVQNRGVPPPPRGECAMQTECLMLSCCCFVLFGVVLGLGAVVLPRCVVSVHVSSVPCPIPRLGAAAGSAMSLASRVCVQAPKGKTVTKKPTTASRTNRHPSIAQHDAGRSQQPVEVVRPKTSPTPPCDFKRGAL